MGYRYIALINDVAGAADDDECLSIDKFRDLALESRGRVRRATIFTSKETPTLSLPGGTVLLGDLYDRDGRPVVNAACFPYLSTQRALRQHLLDNYWGEYLLIQPIDEDNDGVSFMRDPSGGVACAHAPKGGFVTSDPSIASHLGLYREKIDWEFVSHCLIYPYMKISCTGFADIRELLPGCVLTAANKTTRVDLAWSPWSFVAPAERQCDPTAAAQTIRNVTTSVVRAMAETDGSLLLELSGGLDSSIIGVSLASARARIAACNAISPLPGADERQYAKQLADQLGIELLERLLGFEESGIEFPLPRNSLRPAVSLLARMAARTMDDVAELRHVNSVYSGGGGDAIFCYLHSAAPAADAFLSRNLSACGQTIINLSKLHGCTVAKAARLTLRKLRLGPKPACKPDYALLAQNHTAPSLEQHPWFTVPAGALPGDRERIFDLAGNQLFADVMLRADHRRVRMPLLSQPVMEACLRVPSWLWISGGRDRAVARSAFSDQLPADILNRRSKGNFMSYTSAIYRRNKEAIRQFLLDGQLHSRGLLDADKLNLFLDSPLTARDQSFMRVFDLCMIENWIRNHA